MFSNALPHPHKLSQVVILHPHGLRRLRWLQAVSMRRLFVEYWMTLLSASGWFLQDVLVVEMCYASWKPCGHGIKACIEDEQERGHSAFFVEYWTTLLSGCCCWRLDGWIFQSASFLSHPPPPFHLNHNTQHCTGVSDIRPLPPYFQNDITANIEVPIVKNQYWGMYQCDANMLTQAPSIISSATSTL